MLFKFFLIVLWLQLIFLFDKSYYGKDGCTPLAPPGGLEIAECLFLDCVSFAIPKIRTFATPKFGHLPSPKTVHLPGGQLPPPCFFFFWRTFHGFFDLKIMDQGWEGGGA